MTAHSPVTPDWTCAGCGREWPCPSRRGELLAEYDGALVSLVVYLGNHLVAAVADLPQVPAGRLHHRIVGWVRDAGARRPVTATGVSSVRSSR